MDATASGQGRVYQAAGNQIINHHYPPRPEPGQIVEGDIPQCPPGFQPRPQLLQRLADLLGEPVQDGQGSAGGGAVVICALAGTPGVGKTMLAASYAWACQAARWPVVAWIAAETTDQILTGLAALAERLGERRSDEDAAAAARRAKAWLAATAQPALLVFDNATDVAAIRRWCPATGAARVVITTRNRAFARAYAPLEVEVFTPGQAEAFLRRRTGLTDPDGAAELAHELGHLPLALAQAAAVIVRLRLSCAGYLELLRDFPVGDQLTAQHGDAYPAGTAEAIMLSVTQAESALPFAHDLLSILAVLSPSGVPLQVLSALSDAGSGGSIEPVRLREMLADLTDTSLITFSEDGTTVLMHRLIQRVLCDRAAHHGDLDAVLDQAIALLQDYTDTLPDGAQTWAARAAVEMLIDQSDALYRRVPADELPDDLLALRIWCGRSLHDLAELARAVQLLEATLADCERVLGPDHPHTLISRTYLAFAYREAGDLGRAIPLYEATLADCERVLGADHPDTLMSRNNLSGAYHAAGDWRRAIALLEATLADLERVLGLDHPETLTSRHNLAVAYQEAGDLSRAIRLFKAALIGREHVLGPDHPSTLTTRNNLASAHQAAGDLKRAIRLFEATVSDYERVLSPDHPDTLTCRTNLANAYQAAGDLDQAIPLYEQTLAERERVLGSDHPDTLTSHIYLANAYQMAGDLDRAILLLKASVSGHERVLGADHPDTLTSHTYLANAYRAAGDLKRAILLLKASVSDHERVLGADHPSTLACRNNLADAYEAAGNLGRAIPLYEATLTDRERVLGPDHPETLASRGNLAGAYRAAGGLGPAIALYTTTLTDCERVLGSDHPMTRVVRGNLVVLASEAALRKARGRR